MKNVILFLTALAALFSEASLAQDINTIFNNKLTLDAHLSNQTKAMDGLMAAYGEVQTKVYSYEGSFEDAVDNMKAPHNANVSTVTNQHLGNNFSAFILMTENFDPKPMSSTWYDKAGEKANEP